ncbi:hypothetical protein [Streptomyces sp. NPDC048057]|uniref:hypothetical protein n=1 Tax=Streptomyces sp. NPDC048057 TaxID=3155628 RepID=UPI0033F0631E
MPSTIDPATETEDRDSEASRCGGLVRARRDIHVARDRNSLLGDGGGTGRSDGND